MKKIYLLYLVIAIGIMTGGLLLAGGRLLWYFHPRSIILTLGPPLIILLGHFSPREIIDAFKCAGVAERNESDLKKSLLFFDSFHRLTIISGFITFMLGLILMLITQDLSNDTKIGPFLAIAVLTILYVLFVIMTITVPFQSAIKKKLIK